MSYEACTFQATPQKIEKILNESFKLDDMFTDYRPACEAKCGYCPLCMQRKWIIAQNIWNPRAVAFEVWKDADFVGIMYVRDIVPGHDALAEFTFWDKDLRGKSTIIKRVLDRAVFGDLGLHRVTVELPHTKKLKGLRKFVLQKLGFEEEGTKREAVLFDGVWTDVTIYGKIKDAGREGNNSDTGDV